MGKEIKLFAMDVDGTMTDGKIYMGNSGEIMKVFDIKDGYAIHDLLPSHGVRTVIITARTSEIVEKRGKELEIDFEFQGVKDKVLAAKELCKALGLSMDNLAYVGDDDGDEALLKQVGFAACPANASAKAKAASDYISKRDGGDGAIRDIAEWMIHNGMLGERKA